jgi:hypothetical protein
VACLGRASSRPDIPDSPDVPEFSEFPEFPERADLPHLSDQEAEAASRWHSLAFNWLATMTKAS